LPWRKETARNLKSKTQGRVNDHENTWVKERENPHSCSKFDFVEFGSANDEYCVMYKLGVMILAPTGRHT
jgi:4-hydroxyphenylpyruvate dioxygenase-like putative hemolysin